MFQEGLPEILEGLEAVGAAVAATATVAKLALSAPSTTDSPPTTASMWLYASHCPNFMKRSTSCRAIPGSFLLGMLVLSSLGLTINIVVLFSLILAVGMLVDGAIVVTEFAYRKMAEGLRA